MKILIAYLSTIYGAILWVVIALRIEKDQYDDINKKFNWRKYKAKNWDNWLFALVAIPLAAHWMPDLVLIFFPQYTFTSLGYGLSGIVMQILYWKLKNHFAEQGIKP